MKKVKRAISQSFKRLSVLDDDESELSSYRPSASPLGNGYQPGTRISLPPNSLNSLYGIPPNEYVYQQPYHGSRGNMLHAYEYTQINGDMGRNSLGVPLQKTHLHSSSSSFIDPHDYRQPQVSQHIYGPPRIYANPHQPQPELTAYHVHMGGVASQLQQQQQQPEFQDSIEHNMTRSCNESYYYNQQRPEMVAVNGKQKPPLPRTPSKKISLKTKRALSIAEIFSIRRSKPSANGDGKSNGPMKVLQKPNSTHEDMFSNIIQRDDISGSQSHNATMNRTVNSGGITPNGTGGGAFMYPAFSNPGLNHTNTLPLHHQQYNPYAPHQGHLNGINNNVYHPPLQPMNSSGSNISRGDPRIDQRSMRMDPRDLRDQHVFLQQQQLQQQHNLTHHHSHSLLKQKSSITNGATKPVVYPLANPKMSKSITAMDKESSMYGHSNHVSNSSDYTSVTRRPRRTKSGIGGVESDPYFKRYSTPAFCSTSSFVPNGGKYGKIENYKRLEVLGEGSYATVYKGVSLMTGNEVALKEIRLNEEEGAPFTAIREASLLRELVHANIVKLHDIIYNTKQLIFVFEYLCTDLNHYLERYGNGGLNPHNVKLFLFQLLRGLAFIHDRKILHRDLKPQNLLISQHGELKLADFGLARAKSVPTQSYSNEVVTLWYRPPDILLGSTQYSTQLDMWGVGCIFCEMISGLPTFPGVKDPRDQLLKIFRILGTPDESTWPGVSELPLFKDFKKYKGHTLEKSMPKMMLIPHAEDLAKSLLKCNPSERISARDSLQSAYFKKLPNTLFTLPDEQSIMFVEGISLEAEREAPRNLMKTYYNP